jgi:hypothetical protein
MTTKLAAMRHGADHVREYNGRPLAVYNPHNKPIDELPFIYGFNNGGSGDNWTAQLLSADGMGLGSHWCSSEAYMPADLGCLKGTRPDRHEGFRKHYPNGYQMAFIPTSEMESHEGFQAAIAEAKRKFEAGEK